jgi:hypothetical protein
MDNIFQYQILFICFEINSNKRLNITKLSDDEFILTFYKLYHYYDQQIQFLKKHFYLSIIIKLYCHYLKIFLNLLWLHNYLKLYKFEITIIIQQNINMILFYLIDIKEMNVLVIHL